jgi:hypothetical protein
MYQCPIIGKEKVFITTIIYLRYLNSFFFFENHERNPPPYGAGVGNSIGPNILRAS